MDVVEAMQTRKSIRGYKPDPVPKEIIREILHVAMRTPSATNTQPWEFTVVAGETLDKIRKGNLEKLAQVGKDHKAFFNYDGVYKTRQVDLAKQLFALMDIKREDKEKRDEWLKRGFRFFDAPAAIIITMDSSIEGSWAPLDIGGVSYAIALLAPKYGLGTCIEAQGVAFPEVIREHTGLPENKKVVIGISIGYPDWDFPANALQSEREDVDNVTTWIGFD